MSTSEDNKPKDDSYSTTTIIIIVVSCLVGVGLGGWLIYSQTSSNSGGGIPQKGSLAKYSYGNRMYRM